MCTDLTPNFAVCPIQNCVQKDENLGEVRSRKSLDRWSVARRCTKMYVVTTPGWWLCKCGQGRAAGERYLQCTLTLPSLLAAMSNPWCIRSLEEGPRSDPSVYKICPKTCVQNCPKMGISDWTYCSICPGPIQTSTQQCSNVYHHTCQCLPLHSVVCESISSCHWILASSDDLSKYFATQLWFRLQFYCWCHWLNWDYSPSNCVACVWVSLTRIYPGRYFNLTTGPSSTGGLSGCRIMSTISLRALFVTSRSISTFVVTITFILFAISTTSGRSFHFLLPDVFCLPARA